VKEALAGSDTEAIKAANDKLTEAVYKLSAAMYEKAGAEAAPGGEGAPKGDGTMDADFDVKE
jgi:molecular chaperone DnaK